MKKIGILLCALVFVSRIWCETEITIQRAESRINAGFKERIFVDGKEVLVLANGASGKITVPDGNHTIHAELYTLTTGKLDFNARGGVLQFVVTPHTTKNFVIEGASGAVPQAAAAPVRVPKTRVNAAQAPQPAVEGVEGSLIAAAGKIMEKIPEMAKIAIVYMTSDEEDITEFIANELEFIMVDQGLILIDRSQLDKIRREQNLQMSGEVDDDQAVSIGKIAGASIIVTGAVTGNGTLRRLRLRALDTRTAQVIAVASERY
jgi:hypothetical protein